ncbi:FAD binding domain-containing protein [Lentinula raphanica]|nr:FAD binding domain-containing protein [Lentinula raphanica]
MDSKIKESSSADRVHVLIAGAGPVGLVSALILLRNGLTVRIITKETEFRTGYRGPGIQPRTLELYRFLGVLDDIWQGSGSHQTIHQYTSPDNGEPPVIAWNDPEMKRQADKPYLSSRSIGQVDHEAILRAHLLRDYGCQVELGTELVSLEQQSYSVEATFIKTNDKSDPTTHKARFDWLIGADGAHSIVRKQLGCTFLGQSYKQSGMLLADIHLLNGWGDDHIKAWGNIAQKSLLIRPYMSSYSAQHSTPSQPKNDTRVQVMIAGPDVDVIARSVIGEGEMNASTTEGRDALVRIIHEMSGRKDLIFGDLIGMGVWRPNIRMVDKFGTGRVWIAGDAAHVHSPTGGQGLNSGVQDAFNLCWKLSFVHKGLRDGSTTSLRLLDTYSEERVRVVKAMLNVTTNLLKQTFGANSGGAAEAQENGAQSLTANPTSTDSANPSNDKKKPVKEFGFTRGFELRMFGINYRGSSIVVDEVDPPAVVLDPYKVSPDEPVRGGDRAPQAVGLQIIRRSANNIDDAPSTTTLFDVFDTTKHTALVFVGPPIEGLTSSLEAVQEVVKSLGGYPLETMRIMVVHSQDTTSQSLVDGLDGEVLEVKDTEGHAYTTYLRGIAQSELSALDAGQKRPVVIIVRPDGHVGAMVRGVEGIEKYKRSLLA